MERSPHRLAAYPKGGCAMSKAKRIAVIVALCLVGVGLLLTLAAGVLLGFDLVRLNTMRFETVTHTVTEPFDSIDIRDVECDVRLLPAEDGQCRVVCQQSDKIINTVEVEGDTLTVVRQDTRRWYESIGIWWSGELTVTVYLPENEYRSLSVQTVSGDIEVPETFTFADAEAQSTSGDIAFAAHTREGLTVKSVSGSIRAGQAAGGAVEATTTSGDIRLSDMTPQTLRVTTTSGDINLTAVVAAGEAELKAVSGDVSLQGADAASLSIKTVSGRVQGTLLSAKNFISDTTSGDIRLPESVSTAGTCRIETTSGDVSITIGA